MTAAALRSDRFPTIVSRAHEIAPPADLVGLVAAARRAGAPAFYWQKRDADLTIAASGCAWSATAAGRDRFRDAAAAVRRLRAEVACDGDSGSLPSWLSSPIVFAGFSFADEVADCAAWRGFEPARLVLPELCVVRRGGRAAVLRNAVVQPGSDVDALLGGLEAPCRHAENAAATAPRIVARHPVPAPDAWTAAVADAVGAIRGGAFDKLVLARSCRLRADAPYDLASVLRSLAEREVGCTVFSFAASAFAASALGASASSATADADFVGASPEILASLENGELRTFALAGTAPRGATDERDSRLRAALRRSGKDRSEHEFVVRGMRDDLGDLVHSLTVDGDPEVVALRRVQHLRTALRGRIAPHRGILDVAAALHPSPAVGGYPKRRAVAEIARREGFERGWYAAPVGWTNLDGDGELAVGLRSGVLRGRDAWVFAGAGVVRDSDARAELLETELKLQPMLGALGAQDRWSHT